MSGLMGRVALVTGGSRGIGAAIARRLALEGADVALTYVSAAEKAHAVVRDIQALGRRAFAIAADGASPEATQRAVEVTVAELGRLDILVNNAGIFPYGPLESVTLEELERTLAVHVKASFIASQAAARHLGQGGRIINIGTCLVDRVPHSGVTLYSMSKAALTGLTKGLARDLGPRGITANIVHPGPIDTDMNPADGPGADPQRALLALGHYGEGEDIASAVAWLSGEGGRFVTGASIAVDGGYTA
ncbi:3-oxoacyl-ACP reductase FabG [Pyxidicoccus fallax]|uniref:3-oxoacyl-ACP reductase FabG n=1 Tax=Pyxidicoccus fallax TaxID=394095 RepID=A0A848LD20_9BACT|nr:3-oxoacyl-ACP reductase family protein [Pyxidicoccus fallax]NMO14161.1 3-oxoacyl-ACP reductase FabG [Pyxidicoccus fallax]NPC81494.1 3-oxoacyl-ACP reductase FabG [Pyxidicoccus fallax]